MAICVIIGLPTPLLPIHLLWINLITDGLPALCLATDAIDSDVMKHAPRQRHENIADRSFLRTMVFTGSLTAAITFAVYFHVLKTQTPEAARSSAFAVLVFAELLRAFGARSETKPVWRISLAHQHPSPPRHHRVVRPSDSQSAQFCARPIPSHVANVFPGWPSACRVGGDPA